MMIYGKTVFSRNNSHKRYNFRKPKGYISINFETTQKGREFNCLKIYKNVILMVRRFISNWINSVELYVMF